jgi:oligopeptide transport system ATP-binding protein
MALLELNELRVEYRVRGAGRIAAVDGVTLRAERGQCVGLVGESGCGKSTLAQAIVGLTAPVSGEIVLDGRRVWPRRQGHGSFARSVQMVFQDPYSSLNPRWTVGAALREVLRVHGLASRAGAAAEVVRLLECVEMDAGLAARFPHELSGGQRQRVAIARALAVNPALIVADEPVSALDVSVQVQVLNLLKRLQASMGMAILFISHDLATVRYMCDHVSVMYRGRIVESSPTVRLFARPAHPYTAALLSAAPDVEEGLRSRTEGSRRLVLVGEPPPATVQVDGCAFHPRCPWRADRCEEVDPAATDRGEGQRVCCHHPLSAEQGTAEI